MCAPGGVPGTPATRSPDPSWGDSDQGGSLRKGQPKGVVRPTSVKEDRKNTLRAGRTAWGQAPRGRELGVLWGFEETKDPDGWNVRGGAAESRMRLGVRGGQILM